MDTFAVLWREFDLRGAVSSLSLSIEDIEGIWKARVEAEAAVQALIKDLETVRDEARMQRDGVDVWMMFLESVPGRSVEGICHL